jgi:uncharacterized membrane protein YbhN (UPF0104 family)
MLLGAQRLRVLLNPQGFNLTYWTALRLTYLGAFFDTFMITSVGGDAIKAIYLAREVKKGQRLEAVSVLVLDRLMGLLGLLALAVILGVFQIKQLYENQQTAWMIKYLVLVPGALLVGTLMLLSSRVYNSSPMQWLLSVMPMGEMATRAYGSLQKFRDRPGVLLKAFGISLIVHCFGCLTGYVLMLGLGGDAQLAPFIVALLIANFICSFAPAGGIGVGQLVYKPLFESIAAMTHPTGWVLATATQAAMLLAKAPGFIAWVISKEHGRPPDGDPLVGTATLTDKQSEAVSQPTVSPAK